MAEFTSGSAEADHLCVLVHGLWGNPGHMTNIAKALRAEYPEDKLYILAAKRNSGSFTYDGIETGGERVCLEIEETLGVIASKGGKIKKLSVVGYSLGGLVARYAIGLLYAKGVLDELECMTYTAFASPFLGIRTPLRGFSNFFWNGLVARTLGLSGRQMFWMDKFRDTGRPLLAVLSDPNSIFMSGLAKFQKRVLYANIVNDRSAVYYSTSISKTDPYTDLSKLVMNFVPGYDEVILDPTSPVSPDAPIHEKEGIAQWSKKWIKRVPLIVALSVMIPVFISAFLVNSVFQTVRSTRRIKLHESGGMGIKVENYRVPYWINEFREAVEDAYENLNSAQVEEYLPSSSDDEPSPGEPSAATTKRNGAANGKANGKANGAVGSEEQILTAEGKEATHARFPTLALTPEQFAAIKSLDKLGWRKYGVWIHQVRHSHAAIIVRSDKESFSEGHIVMKHWLKEEFVV